MKTTAGAQGHEGAFLGHDAPRGTGAFPYIGNAPDDAPTTPPEGHESKGQFKAPIEAIHFPYVWRVKARLPERKGTLCRVLVRSRMNSCLVEFEDGERFVTSRQYVRKANPSPAIENPQLVLAL